MTKSIAQEYTAYTWAECKDKWQEIYCRCLDRILELMRKDEWRYIYQPAQLSESAMKQIAAIAVMSEGKDLDSQAYSFIFQRIPKAKNRIEEALGGDVN